MAAMLDEGEYLRFLTETSRPPWLQLESMVDIAVLKIPRAGARRSLG